jgi:hypothetical protein
MWSSSVGGMGMTRINIFRRLENNVTALLPTAWEYCCAEIDGEGCRRINNVSDSNAALRTAISALETACKNAGDTDSRLDQVKAATRTLRDSIASLRELCS